MMIKIWSGPHVKFAAMLLRDTLNNLGLPAKIINTIDPCDPSPHIIYQACTLSAVPENYIICQTEVKSSQWFSDHYFQILKNAKAIWDYSPENIPRYSHLNDKICIVTPGIKAMPTKEKDIHYLFYGWIKGSQHRKETIKKMQKSIPLRVETSTLMEEIWEILAQTKTVINIHYYPDSPLELYRLHESLSFGCQVWLEDEQRFYTEAYDNTEEIKKGLKLAGWT